MNNGRKTKIDITQEYLVELYNVKKKTDIQIARQYGVDRTTIVHLRNKYGIKSREKKLRNYLLNPLYTILSSKQLKVTETNDFYLINNWKVKVLTSSSCDSSGRSKFQLTEKSSSGVISSDRYHLLDNGRLKRMLGQFYDFVIFIQYFDEDEINYWIIPSEEVDQAGQSLSLTNSVKNYYYQYYNAWELLQ